MKPSHGPSGLHERNKRKRHTPEHVRLVGKIREQLERASPRSSKGTVAELAIDIGDLASVGKTHWEHVSQLLKMTFPTDRVAFRKLLAKFEVNLLFENQWHLSSLKRLLPRLVKDAYNTSNGRLDARSRRSKAKA